MKIAVCLRAEVFEWTESEGSHNHQSLRKAKREIQEKIEQMIGKRWDFPDGTGKGVTSTTANTARRSLHHGGRDIIIQMLPDCFQPVMRQIGQYLCYSSTFFIRQSHYCKGVQKDLYNFVSPLPEKLSEQT